ncbi:unnamed protein product [Lactuca saligna]|uniref:Uncharacterized protein n=1 Tax=Lactuca saligna TaxID=75948 RepID=A0AA35YR99_LACSI|nr:unnamed protein product [Lactuca saligna]
MNQMMMTSWYLLLICSSFLRRIMLSCQVERLDVQFRSFEYEIQKLHDVAKERHDLFVGKVTKMKESMDQKMDELKSELDNEVEKMEHNYTLLHNKVDVVATAITKLVEFNTDYSTKLEEKLEKDSQVFEKIEEFLSSIKETILKVDLSNQSSVSQ